MLEITYNEHIMRGIVAITFILFFFNYFRTTSVDYRGGDWKLFAKVFAKAALMGTVAAMIVRMLLHMWFE